MRKIFTTLFSIACMATLYSTAYANENPVKVEKERIVLMPLRVPEEDASLQGAMETALVQGLQERYEVFSGEQVSQKAKEIFLKESKKTNTAHKDCDETRCMQDIAEAFQAELIATSNVSKRPDGYFLAISIQNIFDNKVIFSNSVPCKFCDSYQVVDKLKELSGGTVVAPVQVAQKSFKNCPECPEMVIIPAGKFQMGSQITKSEMPVHDVDIPEFSLGRTEITQGQWKAIMGGNNNPSEFKECGDNCPVENVSYEDAQDFIKKLTAKTGKAYRLPSESEWEYACHAKSKDLFCGGDKPANVAWFGANVRKGFNTKISTDTAYKPNGGTSTHPVAGKQPNAFGLYDMSGNVWEWTEDSPHESYIDAPANGSVWKGSSSVHVLRGGSWYHAMEFLRATSRGNFRSDKRNGTFGFRVALSLK